MDSSEKHFELLDEDFPDDCIGAEHLFFESDEGGFL